MLSRASERGKRNLTYDIVLPKWIPVHVGIEDNEYVDVLFKEVRDLDQPSTVTSKDADKVAKRKTSNQRFIKPTIPELNRLRNLSSTVAKLGTVHFKVQTDDIIRWVFNESSALEQVFAIHPGRDADNPYITTVEEA
ncbi:hypothetical protein TNCV_4835011 [Trichonephila clavipes]|nr:hypothetical protein TNCV_4835011 [Trichonephila clavipes]